MEKILVTGAGGFIGYHLCSYLGGLGHAVIGVDLHYPILLPSDANGEIKQHVGDFRDWSRMKNWLAGVDVVFHLAAAHLQVSLDEKEYWDINVHSLSPFLNLAKEAGIRRFVHASSVGVYGNLQEIPANEKTPCKPQSIYGETKLAGEKEVLSFGGKNKFEVVAIRPAWVYGPYCPRTLKIYKTLRKKRFITIGSGNNLRHPVYIVDLLKAFELAMHENAVVGENILVAGPDAVTTNELIECYCRVLQLPKPAIRLPYNLGLLMAVIIERCFGLINREPPISKRSLEFFDTNNSFSIDKAKGLLNFCPEYAFEDGLADSRQWLESQTAG